ncbi:hypothetical protein H6P81_013491 [Aristolochia fimbriata]|uniref:Protein kinase domain-containing protein n=1 Tax=Aristolochia fimbriata TaxID=158543 RepID=A0AAV7EJH6_ARIFI|nr:hypothetical protein H6P81_013491 [Aristolochia fimbriata]
MAPAWKITDILLIFVFSLLVMVGDCRAVNKDVCRPSKCTSDGPEIRSPFRLKEQPDQRCGIGNPNHPVNLFELGCKPNGTVIHLPHDSPAAQHEYYVSSISYVRRRLTLFNPYGCFGAFLFNVDLSSFPFSFILLSDCDDDHEDCFSPYKSTLNAYNFVDCPTKLGGEFWSMDSLQFSCVSEPDRYVYCLNSDDNLDRLSDGCKKLKTVYSAPIFDTFGSYPRRDRRPPLRGANMNDSLIDLVWDPMVESSSEDPMVESPSEAPWTLPANFGFQDYYSDGGTSAMGLAIGLSATFFLLVVLTVVVVRVNLSRKSRREEETENQKVEKFLRDYRALKPKRYSYGEIKRMTDQFKIKLGEGGYGSVYKGALSNGTVVAVKILKMFKLGKNGEDFINEVGTIGTIHHINVVRLLGFCAEGFKKALIYEFMPKGSLDKFIFHVVVGEEEKEERRREQIINWDKAQSIALGIARGIEYLHQGCEQRILHFDIKPNNILLDENLNPKIADFGLAKLCSKEQSIVSMTAARGTVGYIAPEVLSRNSRNVSYKSDVYSFGMLLLEMVGGRKNIDATVENASQVYFPEWAYGRLRGGVDDADLGLKMEEEGDGEIAKKLTMVAFWCIQWYPVDRPSMKNVVQMLEGNLATLPFPPNPFAASAVPNNTRAAATTHESLTVILE